ncbi:MAG TPA: serine/threonine-protein kinase [Polyangiaceae bacterium]|nr:serine/threonine-protein kinase [Polyangiaceae bacterium]
MNDHRSRAARVVELPPKTRLGPYVLGRRIGIGGMAEVYEAVHLSAPGGRATKRALKLILPRWADSPDVAEMFNAEARLSRLLHHPGIASVLDAGRADGRLFIALEFVDGISCARLLRLLNENGQRLGVEGAVYIAMRSLSALSYAHNLRNYAGKKLGVVHRDVSPGNILLSRTGEVKLTDFGIALSDHVERNTNPGEVKGKYGYMSPEQIAGAEVDARSDLFSLGIVLAEILIGQRLFTGNNQYELLTRMHLADISVFESSCKNLPDALVAVVRTSLARRRRDRYQTAMEFLAALLSATTAAGLRLDEHVLARRLYELGVLPQHSGTREITPRNPTPSSPPTTDHTTLPLIKA